MLPSLLAFVVALYALLSVGLLFVRSVLSELLCAQVGFDAAARSRHASLVRYAAHIQYLLGAAVPSALPAGQAAVVASHAAHPAAATAATTTTAPAAAPAATAAPAAAAAGKKATAPKAGGKAPAAGAAAAEEVPDVARVLFKVGRVLEAKMHPDATNLYVEEIDFGESKPRTVVSGLYGKVRPH